MVQLRPFAFWFLTIGDQLIGKIQGMAGTTFTKLVIGVKDCFKSTNNLYKLYPVNLLLFQEALIAQSLQTKLCVNHCLKSF